MDKNFSIDTESNFDQIYCLKQTIEACKLEE